MKKWLLILLILFCFGCNNPFVTFRFKDNFVYKIIEKKLCGDGDYIIYSIMGYNIETNQDFEFRMILDNSFGKIEDFIEYKNGHIYAVTYVDGKPDE